MTHPFFAAEIARQRQESLRVRASLVRARRTGGSLAVASPAPIRWEALADRMAESGPSALEVEVRAVVRAARAAEVRPAVVDVFTDRDAPDIVRQRAFSLIMRALAGGRASARRSNESTHDAA